MPTIRIACTGADVMPISEMHEMQGELKSLSTENYEKLRRHIEGGFKFPFAVWLNPADSRFYILDGHQRYRTLKRMAAEGWSIPSLPVNYIQAATLKEAEATLLGGSSSFGTPEAQGLYEFISNSELTVDEAIELASYSEIDFDDFKAEYFDDTPVVEGKTDEDAVPETAPAVTKLGDIWTLGSHRLMCGDSTDSEQVARLMNGEKADMVFTDPPYGMNLDTDYSKLPSTKKSGNKTYNKVIGDDKEFDPKIIIDLADEVIAFGADYYADKLPKGGSWYVWDKRVTENFDAMIGSAFELAWSKKKHKREIARFNNTLFSGESEAKNKVHPTQKPTKLIEWFFNKIKCHIVVDLFLGSGSTLIACEKTNRKCYGMELDTKYCDIIIKRWQDFTGKQAVRDDGRTFDELAAAL